MGRGWVVAVILVVLLVVAAVVAGAAGVGVVVHDRIWFLNFECMNIYLLYRYRDTYR